MWFRWGRWTRLVKQRRIIVSILRLKSIRVVLLGQRICSRSRAILIDNLLANSRKEWLVRLHQSLISWVLSSITVPPRLVIIILQQAKVLPITFKWSEGSSKTSTTSKTKFNKAAIILSVNQWAMSRWRANPSSSKERTSIKLKVWKMISKSCNFSQCMFKTSKTR